MTHKATSLIETQALTKVYGSGNIAVHALRGVDTLVEKGEFVAVMGPSGSGKSTLMNILGCLDRPTGGTYVLDGANVSGLSKDRLAGVRNAKIGFIFQSYNLLGWVAGVSLIVGGIGIMNIMLVSVTERTKEIGLRQALGARPRDVQLQFLFEAIMLSLIGGLVGVLLGVGGSYLFNALDTMRTELVMSSIPLAFGAAAAVGIFFGYYPATKAAQLDPIVALRHE